MRTYSLITKPYRIKLKKRLNHVLVNPLTNKMINFNDDVEFWCAKVYSQDHTGYKSLFIFNHSFFTTFKLDSSAVKNKWDIIDSDQDWRTDMSILQTTYLALNIFTDGTVPDFVTKKDSN